MIDLGVVDYVTGSIDYVAPPARWATPAVQPREAAGGCAVCLAWSTALGSCEVLDRSKSAINLLEDNGPIELRVVTAGFSDAGEYNVTQPPIEASSDWLSALQDHCVEARLGDDGGLLLSSDGVGNIDGIFLVIVQPGSHIPGISDVHGAADIGQHPPWHLVPLDHSDVTALEVEWDESAHDTTARLARERRASARKAASTSSGR